MITGEQESLVYGMSEEALVEARSPYPRKRQPLFSDAAQFIDGHIANYSFYIVL